MAQPGVHRAQVRARREQTGRDGAHAASRLQCERSTEPGRQRVGEAFDEFEVLHPFARDEVEE